VSSVVLITQGTPKEAQEFCQSRNLPFLCLSDPKRKAYAPYGLTRGSIGQILGPGIWMSGVKAALKGHHVGKPVGDVFQMPGVFIVDRKGIIRFIHRNRDSSDNPSNEVLLANL
jgi:peroxiredoxin